MEQDEKTKQDLASKRRRAAGVGGRTAQFIAATGHRYTPEQARDAVQKSHMAQRLKREQQRQSLPLLRQCHWRAMVVAWKGRPEGVKASSGWRGDYGNISKKVWLRLRDYEGRELIEEYQTEGERRAGIYTPQIYWLRLTAFGEQFYRDNWRQYRELYPEVDAPEPGEQE